MEPDNCQIGTSKFDDLINEWQRAETGQFNCPNAPPTFLEARINRDDHLSVIAQSQKER